MEVTLLVPGYATPIWFLKILEHRLRKDGEQTEIVKLPRYGMGDIKSSAAILKKRIDYWKDKSTSIDIIGYSLGGVIAKYCLKYLGSGKDIRLLFHLCVPQGGIITGLPLLTAPCLTTKAGRQIFIGSRFMESLTQQQGNSVKEIAIYAKGDLMLIPTGCRIVEGGKNICLRWPIMGTLGHWVVPFSSQVYELIKAEKERYKEKSKTG